MIITKLVFRRLVESRDKLQPSIKHGGSCERAHMLMNTWLQSHTDFGMVMEEAEWQSCRGVSAIFLAKLASVSWQRVHQSAAWPARGKSHIAPLQSAYCWQSERWKYLSTHDWLVFIGWHNEFNCLPFRFSITDTVNHFWTRRHDMNELSIFKAYIALV